MKILLAHPLATSTTWTLISAKPRYPDISTLEVDKAGSPKPGPHRMFLNSYKDSSSFWF